MEYKLTKQAFRKLSELIENDPKTAKKVKEIILNLTNSLINGESLKWYSEFKKIRSGKYRIIYTIKDNTLLTTIIEKRETVYQTFEHLFKNSSFFEN